VYSMTTLTGILPSTTMLGTNRGLITTETQEAKPRSLIRTKDCPVLSSEEPWRTTNGRSVGNAAGDGVVPSPEGPYLRSGLRLPDRTTDLGGGPGLIKNQLPSMKRKVETAKVSLKVGAKVSVGGKRCFLYF